MVAMREKEFTRLDFNTALETVRREQNPTVTNIAAVGPEDFSTAPSPRELETIYTRGFRGIQPESTTFEQKVAFRSMMGAMPRLYDIFPWAKDYGKGKINMPYLASLKLAPEWGGDEAQQRGDCTVHGTANSCEVDHGNDALFGETQYKGRLCKENIYRSRGFNGDGWSCQEPCMYVGPEGSGGLLYRQVYTNGSESVDLSKYNPNWEGNGRAGVPAWLEEISRRNKVKWVIPIQSMEEYRDALAIGFGINVCSGQGFSSESDEYGLCGARGSWSHSMAHTACNDTSWANSRYGGMTGGIQQSWGKWANIRGKPDGCPAMPTGMFWAKGATVWSMVRGGDSFAMCSVYGWERTGWEAFDVTGMATHLRNSTTQDYYVERATKAAQLVVEALDSGMFSTAV